MLVREAVSSVPDLEDVLVEGEISNLRMPGSGHLYFTLKDARAALRCVCFRSQAQRVPFRPENGMRVIAHGRVDVYEQDGSYQLYVDDLQPAGVGALAVAVEQVRRRLEAEGLFDPVRKRPLPLLPRRVAVVTSPSGAAVRDVCTVLRRRAPQVGVVVVPTPVQGDGAAYAIVAALRRAQDVRDVDTVLLVRGGGSFEDLYAFQDETLARAVRASRVPVVTGIGHETDWTVADHAADRRAPTPSAAAEVAVPDTARLRLDTGERALRLGQALRQEVETKRRDLDRLRARLGRESPERRLPALRQGVDGRALRLRAALDRQLAGRRRDLDRRSAVLALHSPARRVPVEREGLVRRRAALAAAAGHLLRERSARVRSARDRLEALSPRRVLERGYSITLDAEGHVVASAAAVEPGARLRTLLAQGEVLSRVEEARTEPPEGSTA